MYFLRAATLISALCLEVFTFAQSPIILAGQTTGENIHYVDMEDVVISTSQGDYVYHDIDVDGDGVIDIRFYCQYISFHTGYYEGSGSKGFGGARVGTCPDHNWVKQYDPGDTIGSRCNWSDNATIRGHNYDLTIGEYYSGEFTGEGYEGFAIPKGADTIIGWVRINSISVASMTIYDYAYHSVLTSIENEKSRPGILVNSLVKDRLCLALPFDGNYSEHKYSILDISGKVITSGSLSAGNGYINLSWLPPGLYLLSLKDQDSGHRICRFIKY